MHPFRFPKNPHPPARRRAADTQILGSQDNRLFLSLRQHHCLSFAFLLVYPPFFLCFTLLLLSFCCITRLSFCLPVGVKSSR
jgi:hypothetical protein